MTTSKFIQLRPLTMVAVLAGVVGLSACTSIGYRCPLDPSEKPDSPTACAGMNDAMQGAKKGTGGKTSVLLDSQGRIVPPESLAGRPAQPLAAAAGRGVEPYQAATGSPVFVQPKVFQAYTSSFKDANGALHDGHTAWFTTPGRWAYGSMDAAGDITGQVMRPANPLDLPAGRVLTPDEAKTRQAQTQQAAAQSAQPATQQARDKAALQTLSDAASSASNKSGQSTRPATAATPVQTTPPQAAAGVTAPAIQLNN